MKLSSRNIKRHINEDKTSKKWITSDELFNESDVNSEYDEDDELNDEVEFDECDNSFDECDKSFDECDDSKAIKEYEDYEDDDDYEDDEDIQDFPDYSEVDIECQGEDCDDELSDDDIDDIYSDDYEEDDLDDIFDDIYNESLNVKHHKKLLEKRKGCCPPKRNRMINLAESYKNLKRNVLNETILKRAMRKAKNENPINRKLKEIKENLGTTKFNMVSNAISKGKKTLYENKKINGKYISKYSSKELYAIYKKVEEQIKSLNKQIKSLNENKNSKKYKDLKEELDLKKKLFNLLDEELTYRLTIKKMLREEEEEKTDNASKEDSKDDSKEDSEEDTKEENPDEDEEVELSRVVITLASEDAANELKTTLIDAGIPEDSLEIETEEDTEEGSEENTEEDSEEDTKESTEEGSEEETSESLYYNKFKKLLEDDTEENSEEGSEEKSDDDSEEGSEEDTEESEEVKLILTNTDYISTLADVLETEYGISKDEFEEMIGGEILDDSEDNEESSEDDSEETSKGDDAIDNMSDEELNKLFGQA